MTFKQKERWPALQLQYDIEFTIATAPQRFAKKWKHTKTTWTHLLERLSKPTVTGETVAEYKAMKKSDRDNRKDIGGFVCGYLKDGQRLKQNVEYRQVVCLVVIPYYLSLRYNTC